MNTKEVATDIVYDIFCGPDELPHGDSLGDVIDRVIELLDAAVAKDELQDT